MTVTSRNLHHVARQGSQQLCDTRGPIVLGLGGGQRVVYLFFVCQVQYRQIKIILEFFLLQVQIQIGNAFRIELFILDRCSSSCGVLITGLNADTAFDGEFIMFVTQIQMNSAGLTSVFTCDGTKNAPRRGWGDIFEVGGIPLVHKPLHKKEAIFRINYGLCNVMRYITLFCRN